MEKYVLARLMLLYRFLKLNKYLKPAMLKEKQYEKSRVSRAPLKQTNK